MEPFEWEPEYTTVARTIPRTGATQRLFLD